MLETALQFVLETVPQKTLLIGGASLWFGTVVVAFTKGFFSGRYHKMVAEYNDARIRKHLIEAFFNRYRPWVDKDNQTIFHSAGFANLKVENKWKKNHKPHKDKTIPFTYAEIYYLRDYINAKKKEALQKQAEQFVRDCEAGRI